jgi:hypothetical protein
MTNSEDAASRVRAAMTDRRRLRKGRSDLAATIRWLNELRPAAGSQRIRRPPPAKGLSA